MYIMLSAPKIEKDAARAVKRVDNLTIQEALSSSSCQEVAPCQDCR